MHISWLGLSAFKLETKDAVLVLDPYGPSVAPRPLRAKADIVTTSNPHSPAHGYLDGIIGEPFVIDHPGEFEVKGVFIHGIPVGGSASTHGDRVGGTQGKRPATDGETASEPTLFTFDHEGLRLVHVGDLRAVPASDILESLNGVDILFLPVGGGDTLDAEAAMRVVNAMEPRVVVPMHFRQDGWKVTEKLQPVSAFLREIGSSKIDPVERFSVKKRDLSGEETTVVLFTA
ncbi:MAG: hypothetical protein G01um1014106_541 [Parcubacteria group bacterium Gr01-1014_106]|nr:MAG: hypothetical protein G01um1014106_541 [Parcubacteria group bacterium Gr01-1014_106]